MSETKLSPEAVAREWLIDSLPTDEHDTHLEDLTDLIRREREAARAEAFDAAVEAIIVNVQPDVFRLRGAEPAVAAARRACIEGEADAES